MSTSKRHLFRLAAAAVATAALSPALAQGAAVPGEPPPVPILRARTMAVEAAEAPLPVEAGKATVTVNVSGTVQMVK